MTPEQLQKLREECYQETYNKLIARIQQLENLLPNFWVYLIKSIQEVLPELIEDVCWQYSSPVERIQPRLPLKDIGDLIQSALQQNMHIGDILTTAKIQSYYDALSKIKLTNAFLSQVIDQNKYANLNEQDAKIFMLEMLTDSVPED